MNPWTWYVCVWPCLPTSSWRVNKDVELGIGSQHRKMPGVFLEATEIWKSTCFKIQSLRWDMPKIGTIFWRFHIFGRGYLPWSNRWIIEFVSAQDSDSSGTIEVVTRQFIDSHFNPFQIFGTLKTMENIWKLSDVTKLYECFLPKKTRWMFGWIFLWTLLTMRLNFLDHSVVGLMTQRQRHVLLNTIYCNWAARCGSEISGFGSVFYLLASRW